MFDDLLVPGQVERGTTEKVERGTRKGRQNEERWKRVKTNDKECG